MYKLTNGPTILRLSDGALIPADDANRDYVEYQEWWQKGNEPEPYVVPYVDPNDAILAEIKALEAGQMLPRVTREFMRLTMEAQFTPDQLAFSKGYVALKEFDDSITALRSKLK